jgi:PAS domain S-box-containing protein
MAKINKNKEIRCLHCNKLLALQNYQTAKFELKCLRCGQVNSVLCRPDYLIFITDPKGRILYINKNVKHFSGYSAKEILGKTPAVWGKQMPLHFYRELWGNILKKKKAVSVMITNRHKNGSIYKVRQNISPILNSRGGVDSFLAVQHLI